MVQSFETGGGCALAVVSDTDYIQATAIFVKVTSQQTTYMVLDFFIYSQKSYKLIIYFAFIILNVHKSFDVIFRLTSLAA